MQDSRNCLLGLAVLAVAAVQPALNKKLTAVMGIMPQ